ncbi:MAG: TIR domain-containing protein [Candidatus Bathyarchaeota archaeon]|nr:TIR domain-containing protein [Candidatus Termiticorpusculum sp.]
MNKVNSFIPPLTVIFMWHHKDASENPEDESAKSLSIQLSEWLSKDVTKPFSRSANLPVFLYTNERTQTMPEIQDLGGKTMFFPFIGKEFMSDDKWLSSIENMNLAENICMVPIALDKTALTLKGSYKNRNFIRAYDFEEKVRYDHIFIEIVHEIYRYVLNNSSSESSKGKDKALKLFLSHTKHKHDPQGEEIAKALKNFIDNSHMNSFFDTTDIAPGYQFDTEIEEHIKDSTVIAINTDNYSSSYWCQREILWAKKHNRPIIVVDALKNSEDRRTPLLTNIPSIHIHHNATPPLKLICSFVENPTPILSEQFNIVHEFHDELNVGPFKKNLLEIIKAALIETLRFKYAHLLLIAYQKKKWIDNSALILNRPPEVSDIEKLFVIKDGNIQYNDRYTRFVYPDPPVFEEEVAFLKSLDIPVETPLTTNICSLEGTNIGMSFAYPSQKELLMIGHNDTSLKVLSQEISRYLLDCNATLVCGGDARDDGFTEFIYPYAKVLRAKYPKKEFQIINYVAWTTSIEDPEKAKEWKREIMDVSKVIEVGRPDDVSKLVSNREEYVALSEAKSKGKYRFVRSRCLTEMRKAMDAKCDARICAGGDSSSRGFMSGVLEEIVIAGKRGLPLYLIGGFGGFTASVCEAIKTGKVPEELTLDWQKRKNEGFKEVFDFINSNYPTYIINYQKSIDTIKTLKLTELNNGLSKEENEQLFNSRYIDEIVFLIRKGLAKKLNNKSLKTWHMYG